MKRLGIRVALGVGLFATFAQAQRAWDGGGDGANWSSDANWNPDGPINGNYVRGFDEVGVGTVTHVDALTSVNDLYYRNTSGTHTTALDAPLSMNGGELRVGYGIGPSAAVIQNGTLLQNGTWWRIGNRSGGVDGAGTLTLNGVALTGANLGYVRIGFGEEGTNGAAVGIVDLTGASGQFSQRGGDFRVGAGHQARGVLAFGPALTASIGIPSSRIDIRVGDSDQQSTAGSRADGVVSAGGVWRSFSSYFMAGANDAATGSATGVVDLVSAAAGSSLETAGADLRVGFGTRVHGTLTLSSNVAVRIGQPGETTAVRIGYVTAAGNSNGETTVGLVTRNGAGLFDANLNDLRVGDNFYNTGAAVGTLDASAATTGTVSGVGGYWFVGTGRNAAGLVQFASALAVAIGRTNATTELNLGDTRGQITDGTQGEIVKPGGVFQAHLNSCRIGRNDHVATGQGSSVGRLDLSGITAGEFAVHGVETTVGFMTAATGTLAFSSAMNVALGYSTTERSYIRIGDSFGDHGGNQVGRVTKPGGACSIYGHELRVGVRETEQPGFAEGVLDMGGTTAGTVDLAGGELRAGLGRNVTGTITFGDGQMVLIGNADNRTSMYVGQSDGGSIASGVTGRVTKAGGTFGGYLNRVNVGYNIRNDLVSSAVGVLNLTGVTGGTWDQNGYELRVGFRANATGSLVFGDAMDVRLGTGNPTEFSIGRTEGCVGVSSGVVTKAGGAFSANLSRFWVGFNDGDGQGRADGTLDLSGVTSGTITQNADSVCIGLRTDGTGSVSLGATDDQFGRAADARTELRIGETLGAGGTRSQGVLTKTGGTFGAYLSWFRVGYNSNPGANAADGTLDLTGTMLKSAGIDVEQTMSVGYGANAIGVAQLPAGVLNLTRLEVGDNGGSGLVVLQGTQVTMSDWLHIGTGGSIDAHIAGGASGITLANAATEAMVVNNTNGGLELIFGNPAEPPSREAPYWGFRWQGADHVAALTNLLAVAGSAYTGSGAITVRAASGATLIDPRDVTIAVMPGYTYIGFTNAASPRTGLMMVFH